MNYELELNPNKLVSYLGKPCKEFTKADIVRYIKENGIRTHVLNKLSDGSEEIIESIRQGHIAYVINTSDSSSSGVAKDGHEIRKCATENNVTIFTSLDTVSVLLDVLEETTLTISTIDA